MTYKILFIAIPLVLSSTVRLPVKRDFDDINAKIKPSLSLLSDDPIVISSIVPAHDDYFYCDPYGPFQLTSATNFVATFTYEIHSVSDQRIIERIRLFDSDDTCVSATSQPSFNYVRGTRHEASFNVPLRDYWSTNGLTLKFEILNSSTRVIIKSYSVTFYPPSNATIPYVALKQNFYISKSLGFYGKENQMKELKEGYDFRIIGDYLNVDSYYRLDIHNNHFLYYNDFQFTYRNAYIYFNDSENLFPYYTHSAVGDITIPIKIVRNDILMTFRYNKTFYLNKRTLQISDTYRAGYIATNDFYLPVNGRKKFNGKQIYLVLSGLGMDGISTTIPFKYDTSKSLVGLCTDGDYCIVGGRR